MTHVRRAPLASPMVVRYWLLGLFAWAVLLFIAASPAHGNSGGSADSRAAGYQEPPEGVIPIHVFEEQYLRVLRADMTGDFSARVSPNTCGHSSADHAAGAGCDAFAGVPGLARNNGNAPFWLATLPTH